MFVTSFLGLLTFGLVFNHAAANLITKSSEDENSKWRKNGNLFPPKIFHYEKTYFPFSKMRKKIFSEEKRFTRQCEQKSYKTGKYYCCTLHKFHYSKALATEQHSFYFYGRVLACQPDMTTLTRRRRRRRCKMRVVRSEQEQENVCKWTFTNYCRRGEKCRLFSEAMRESCEAEISLASREANGLKNVFCRNGEQEPGGKFLGSDISS